MPTYYVSKVATNGYVVGSDGNAGTSKALAKATISSALSAAADGDTVYVNDGSFAGTELGASGYVDFNAKAVTLLPETDYGVVLATSSSIVMRFRNDTVTQMTVGAFVIDGEVPGAPGTYVATGVQIDNPTVAVFHIFNKTVFKNFTTQVIADNAQRGTLKLLDVVFAGFMKDGLQGSTSMASAAAKTYHIDGLTLSDVVSTDPNACVVVSATRLSTSTNPFSFYARNITGTITAPATLGTTATVAIVVATGITRANNLAGVSAPLTIEGCDVTINGYSTTNSCYGFLIVNSAAGAAATAHGPLVRNNTLRFNAPAGYGISIGDTSTAYDVNDAVVYGNVVTVPYYANSTPHCIAIGRVAGGLVYGNTTYGGYVGILLGINQGAVVTGNLCVGCYGFALYSKGCGATTRPIMCQNTVVLTNQFGAARAAALGVAIQGATNNADTLFQNNVVYAQTDLYRYVDVGTSQAATFVKNDYYSAGPTGFTSPWSYQSSLYTTFAAWAAARETGALNVDPLFTSYNQFNTRATSPLRRTGAWCTNAARDHRGRPCLVPPDIGAYQASKNDPR